MNPVSNPFAPGAGNQPPELAGRATILEDASTAIQRAKLGKHSRSQMLLPMMWRGAKELAFPAYIVKSRLRVSQQSL